MAGTISSPAVSWGRVYTGSDDGYMHCFSALNGSQIWSKKVNGAVKSSPVVAGGMVYFGTSTDEGMIYAVDANNGSVIWTYPINEYIMSSPAVHDGVLFIGADDGYLYAFGSKPSNVIWKGDVSLPEGSFNVTASSGSIYSVNWTSALGVLYAAAEMGEFNCTVSDALYGMYGLTVDSIGDVAADRAEIWKYWVNYPNESVPVVGPDAFELKDGDVVTFYYGDRGATPETSPAVRITARISSKKPEKARLLYITGGDRCHPDLLKAAKALQEEGFDLNVSAYTMAEHDVTTLPGDINFSQYNFIFIRIGPKEFLSIKPGVEEAKNNGTYVVKIFPPYQEINNINLSEYPRIEEYWTNRNYENKKRLLVYLGVEFFGWNREVEPPVILPKSYIFHPDAESTFENLTGYLEWYRNKTGYRYNESAITIGVMNYYDTNPLARRTLISELESRGANVIDIGFSNTTTMKRFFIQNNTSIVDAAILTKPFMINYGDPDQGRHDLLELGIPVLRGIWLYYQKPGEWKNATGLSPIEIYFQVALPEIDGVIEPIVIAGRAEKTYKPIGSQVEWMADRAISWAELRRTPNSEKRVAIIYYNHGGGKDNIGACYIDVPESLRNILDGMGEAGYTVEGEIPGEKDLLDQMVHQGTNVGTWAPGELESMVLAGNATLIPEEVYLSWFSTIPSNKQKEVVERWGPPPGEIMVYQNESGKYLVIPKLSFGNVILCPQPTRGWLQNNTILYHSKDIPPHHQYIAFYLWLKQGFKADAIVHLGKHGTQEWLPGKESGLSREDCWPVVLIQDLPVVYPYIVDNIAEGTQAKRRGDAVMITHLTPPIVASGLYGNLTNLARTAYNYNHVENATVKEKYMEEILTQSRELHLDEDLGVDLEQISSDPAAFDEFVGELEDFLYDLKNEFMPYGLHIFGEPPEGDSLLGMVGSMLGEDYKREVALMISYDDYPNPSRLDKEGELANSTRDLLDETLLKGTAPEEAQKKVLGSVSENLTAELNLSVVYAEDLGSCTIEVPRLLNALESRYTPPSPADDPIRDPEVLPTGRNFRSISPCTVPTQGAWEAGQEVADKLIVQYREDNNGTYPRKLAIVLWAWAMTDHGVVESEILHLIGAKPKWDGYGKVFDVELVPLSELGRPRIDVVVVPSGLHRDIFPEKLKFIDRAIRLAANDTDTSYPNYVRENSQEIYEHLIETGNYTEEGALNLSRSRIFLEAPGTYGPNLDSTIGASDTWENDTKLGNLFIERMSYIYGDDIWGSVGPSGESFSDVQNDLFRHNLGEVDAAVHNTNSNLYGFIDNDDVFQYLGGIGLAVRTVTGMTPSMYVTDVRNPDSLKVEPLHDFFVREMRSRYLNPRWIQGMQEHGYAGAREMDKFTEYLWGWDVTVPELVTETMWNQAYDVYVNDKYDMGLKEFFDANNPYAYQVMTARMLETSRKGYWHPTEEMEKKLAEEFERSKQEYGVACCHHTCGNPFLREYMQGVLTGTEATKSSSGKAKSEGSSRHPYRPSSSGVANQTQISGVGTSAERPAEATKAESTMDEVTGYVMEPVEETSSMPSISGMPLVGILLVLLMLIVIGMGFWRNR